MLKNSIDAYAANNKFVKICKMPDCDYLGEVNQFYQFFICEKCQVKQCIDCGIKFHEEMTCAEYRASEAAKKAREHELDLKAMNAEAG